MNIYKTEFTVPTNARTLHDALQGADALIGLSIAGAVTQEMIMGMARDPLLFVLANPTPEIMPELALEVRPDAIIGTGRSDYVNQVNNVLGFPFIFRGALDVYATGINEEMKMAAARALAALTHEDVPDSVLMAYGRRINQVRGGLSDSQAARSARDALGGAGGGGSGDAIGRRPPPDRHRGI